MRGRRLALLAVVCALNSFPLTETHAQSPGKERLTQLKSMVWADPHNKIYYMNLDRQYGKTKGGAWMSEKQAKARGYKKAKLKDTVPKPPK